MSNAPTETTARGTRPMGTGGGRLADAFDAVSAMPVLAEARRRALEACAGESTSVGEIAEIVESDASLAIGVVQTANHGGGPSGRIGGITEAIEALEPSGVGAAVSALATYDLLERSGDGSLRYERFRLHAVAVRHAADRIAELARLPQREEIAVAALLHDVGRLVLFELYGDAHGADTGGIAPDERARRERRELGIDHAVVGGVLARRWGLSAPIATAIERHHAADAEGTAAAVRLADLLVHRCAGEEVPTESLRSTASRIGIDLDQLRTLMFEFPHFSRARRGPSAPCPLSTREIDALRGLAAGKVYKQIARELSLSVSTVRTHLHNVYGKIGAVDRAQAVLIARDRGWI